MSIASSKRRAIACVIAATSARRSPVGCTSMLQARARKRSRPVRHDAPTISGVPAMRARAAGPLGIVVSRPKNVTGTPPPSRSRSATSATTSCRLSALVIGRRARRNGTSWIRPTPRRARRNSNSTRGRISSTGASARMPCLATSVPYGSKFPKWGSATTAPPRITGPHLSHSSTLTKCSMRSIG